MITITRHPGVMNGEPCIGDTNVLAMLVLGEIADGRPEAEILRRHPAMPAGSIKAVREWGIGRWVMQPARGETEEEFAAAAATYRKMFEEAAK
jgi:uncharacterized protein (DUF433 family)